MNAIATGHGVIALALLDPERPSPAIDPSLGDAPRQHRFAIHRNNVVSSLIDALAETFPVSQQLVGIDFFRAMTSIFVRRSPPRSRVLALYGDAFPAFIDGFEPARSVPYLADVARVEYARMVAYYAADRDALTRDEARAILGSGEHADALLLTTHPSVIPIDSPYAAVSIWAAHQQQRSLEHVPVERPESCLVLREGQDVLVVPVAPSVTAFVRSIKSGLPLGEAVAEASAIDSGFDLAAALQMLMHRGALTSMRYPELFA